MGTFRNFVKRILKQFFWPYLFAKKNSSNWSWKCRLFFFRTSFWYYFLAEIIVLCSVEKANNLNFHKHFAVYYAVSHQFLHAAHDSICGNFFPKTFQEALLKTSCVCLLCGLNKNIQATWNGFYVFLQSAKPKNKQWLIFAKLVIRIFRLLRKKTPKMPLWGAYQNWWKTAQYTFKKPKNCEYIFW